MSSTHHHVLRPLLATSVALAASLVAVGLAASPALAAPAPPTITSAFTPAAITVGSTSALSITITNPGTSSLSGIAVTDNLPAGVVVDNPNGQNGTCGSAGVVTADPGVAQIALAGGTLSAGASCTISADVTASAAGAYANSTGPVTYTAGSTTGSGDTETLTVVGEPTVAITAPASNAVFTFGQKVDAAYTCADPTGAPAVSGCLGDVNSGAPIDTRHAGSHTFTVTATNAIGGLTTETVGYTVLPDNVTSESSVTTHKGGKADFTIKVPGPGRVSVSATVSGYKGSFTLETLPPLRTNGSPLDVHLAPTKAALKQLLAAKAAGKAPDLELHIVVRFTPKGGRPGHETLPAVQLGV